MRKTLLIIIFLQFSTRVSYSQTDCEKILSEEINLTFSEKSDLDILNNTFSKLTDCGLEQIDVDFFANGPILATLLVPLISENDRKVTYQNLFDKIMEFKQTSQYEKTIEIFKVSNELSERKAELKNWEEDRKLFQRLQIPNDYINEFYEFFKQNADSTKTYKEVFENFKSQKKQFDVPIIINDSEDYSGLFKNPGVLNYSDLLNKAKEKDKPIILYFNGYACVNARKIEEYVLRNDEIIKKLTNDFIFVNVYVDDKKQIPEEQWTIDKQSGKTVKTVGMKNSKFQIDNFQNNLCPYFVIIDNNGKKIKERGYTRDLIEFEEFLNITE